MADLVLGTRGSPLALWQARHVSGRLEESCPGSKVELRVIKTEGDIQQTLPLQSSDVGVFVRRIEQCLASGEIDLAVHSLKDLPTTQPEGLTLAAVLTRHDPRDALLSVEGFTVQDLPPGATIATCSPRRQAQLRACRPDVAFVPLRGNVDSRVAKLRNGEFSALVLAVAGVERLGIDSVQIRPIEPEICLPAVGQGAVVVETRSDDARTRGLVATLDDEATHTAVRAERAFLRRLGGGCMAPATAHARIEGRQLVLASWVGSLDASRVLVEAESGPHAQAQTLGEAMADRMLQAGAGEVLTAARQGETPDHGTA